MKITSKVKKRTTEMFSAIFFIAGLFFTSCNKDKDDLGTAVHPEGDELGLVTTDTLSLVTYSKIPDSIVTDELPESNLLGSYVDQYFGKVDASVYTQIRLEGAVDFTPDGGTVGDIAVDSVVFYMELDGLYGNQDAQTIEVYQVTEDFYLDSTYYSNSSLSNNGINLVESGSAEITPNSELLRVKLDVNTFALPIINESGTGVLDGNDGDGKFVDWFKGLHIRTNNPSQVSSEGAILYLNLESSSSKVTMYYRHTLGPVTEHDTLEFDFNINSNCARFSNISFDRTGTQVEEVLSDSIKGEELFFTQTMGGPRAMVAIPYLENLLDSGNVVVNKAQLILPVQYFAGDPFGPSELLYLTRTNEEGELNFIPDYVEDSGGYFSLASSSYTFNITRYVNAVLAGNIEHLPLTVVSSSNGVTANRVVFNGTNTILKDKPKVLITYSKYE